MGESSVPIEKDLKAALGETYDFWQSVLHYCFNNIPPAKGVEFSREKYGWSFRIKDGNELFSISCPWLGYIRVALFLVGKLMI